MKVPSPIITTRTLKRNIMAKFNEGELGGIYYKATPAGFRKWLRVGKISPIPYILGDDIKMNLLIKRTEVGTWWTEGVVKPHLPKYLNFPFEIGIPDKKGKWTGELPVGHPTTPVVFSCDLQLQNVQETDDYLRPKIQQVSQEIITGLRAISDTTAFAWAIPIFVAVIGIIVGILLFN